jgi:alkylation response protein AidB-like acyl-CoA dehydrogenase
MYATEYVQQRPAFGKTVADFQGIQWMIANLAVEIEACRLLTYRAASCVDSGRYGRDVAAYLSMAKYRATGAGGQGLQRLLADARCGRLHRGAPAGAVLP